MQISIEDAEGRLATLLESAANGQDVIITRDGRAVGRLVPVAQPEPASEDEIVAVLSPAARRIWQNRTKLTGVTIAELMSESRQDRR